MSKGIRLRYNGAQDKSFGEHYMLAGEVVTFTSLSRYKLAPDTVFFDRQKEAIKAIYYTREYIGDLNCFDYVPSIVPPNTTHLTEEELESWRMKAHQEYLIHLDQEAYQNNYQ